MTGKQFILALFGTFFFLNLSAQTVWSLEKCIDHAAQNSLTLKQADYAIQDAQLREKSAKNQRLPGVSGSVSGGLQFGRTIDPTTNSFNNQTIGFNSFRVDASATLYNGGRIANTIKQSQIDTEAARLDAEASFDFIALSIANTYLSILNAEEQLKNAQIRLESSQRQLERTDKLIAAGTLPKNDRLDVLAQIARDEQAIVQSQNAIEANYLNLKQLLELDPNADIKIELPDLNRVSAQADIDHLTFREVYAAAIGTQPQVKASQLREKSTLLNVDLARAGMLPTLVLFAGIDTRWSSASKKVIGTTDAVSEQEVFINNMPVNVGFPTTIPIFGDNPYFDQIDQNFGQSVGVQLSIPIYSRGQNKIAMERAQIGVLNARVQTEQTLNTLKTDVQTAIANARAAKLSLEAAEKTFEAAKAAYDNAQSKYELGAISTFDLTTAKNNLDIAERDAVTAKYEYIFRLKVIDYYEGKPLKLN
ncbi:MAG: TolC family protein [Bacteroidetes bacterium]|nr:MAG: TolC family protein [Bacteroidota bacterium]